MRIGVAATPEVAIPTLHWLRGSDHEIIRVISRPDRRTGRGQQFSSSPASAWAIENKIELFRPESALDLVGSIEDLDCVLTIGYGLLIPEKILNLPRFGFLNLHFSLLPAYRGAAPAQRAIENGESVTGVTLFKLDKGMDTGPIYSWAELAIDPQWRSKELLDALSLISPSVVSQALTMIADDIPATAQHGKISTAPKISKQEAQIDFNQSAEIILRRIRAFYPAPGAWSTFNGAVLKVSQAEVVDFDLSPGVIRFSDDQLIVGTAYGAISLITLVPAGKKEMDGRDWARGARLLPGAHLG
ncbi:MAG: methionyl-tRNA formyltransferase [Actinomycetota bacterium]|nr:methionyl-tRNA formyltransferase [Actinomycetota bacterium]